MMYNYSRYKEGRRGAVGCTSHS